MTRGVFRAVRGLAAGIAAGSWAAGWTSVATRCEEAKEKGEKKKEKKDKARPADCYPPGCHCYPKLDYDSWTSNWDGQAPPECASEDLRSRLRKAPTRHLILIRHGQYDLKSETDPPLTELGRQQARIVAERLKLWGVDMLQEDPSRTPHTTPIVKVTSSTVLRAVQTGEIIAEVLGLPLDAKDPLLAEGAPCPVKGWHPDPSEVFQDSARIEAAFRKYCHRSVDGFKAFREEQETGTEKSYEGPPSFEVVSCHGNVIRYFVLRSLQLPPAAWLRTATYNTGITHITFGPTGRVSVRRFGDTGHLTNDMTTYH